MTFEVIATQRGGPQNLTGPVRFYGTEGICNPWARTCGVGFNAETLDGLFSYGGKVTFTLFDPPPPRGLGPRQGRPAAASAAGASPALVVSEPFIPAEGRDSSVVSLHRSVGFGATRVEGDFLLTILEEQPEGDSEVLAFPLTAPCVDLDRTTCLNDDEFRVHASFNTAAGASGVGNTVELTSDTGYFWFFDEDNVEVVVKVLDACGVNGYRWVFAAGLTSVAVDLTVKSQSGEVREYRNPLDVPYQPVLDTTAFPCTEEEVRRAREEEWAARPFEEIDEALERLAARSGHSLRSAGAAGACGASDETLCLTADRFRVEATFRTQDGNEGTARTVELTGDTGYFWFFDEDNGEVVLKVLDACVLNDNFWLFAAGLTNVEVEITVTDTVVGTERTFANPLGTPFAPIQETSVLPCG
ncbi:MAG TPA: hypothetical protein VMT85_14450 [Thermoanaerobaculia bacterium]|nr:hypothetical protein [Thermoanaerobaculia bacterium]